MGLRGVTAREAAGRSRNFPLLSPGSRGAGVRQLQEKLRAAGFDPGPVDGIYGLLTAAAVRELQHTFGLREDGLAGPEVWSVLTDPEALMTRPHTRLPAGEHLQALPLTYRLAWPRLTSQPGAQGQRVFGRTSGGLSRTLLAASMPHLSGMVTHVIAPNPQSVASGHLWELLPLGDLPEEAARAGCDRWALLPARAGRELSLVLAQASLPGRSSPASVSGAQEQGRQGPEHSREQGRSHDGRGCKGVLVDASGFRLPAQLPEFLALLAALRELCSEPGGEEWEAEGESPGRAGGIRLEVVLPAVPAAAGPFWRAFCQTSARLAGRADRLWLSAFRRSEDWPVAGRPLQLVELERMLALARETWMPWRLGVVLPAGGWWADGRPLTRREAQALRQRQCQRHRHRHRQHQLRLRAEVAQAVLPSAPATAEKPRDEASGLLLLGLQAGDGIPEAYLVDQETWRVLLGCAHAAGVGGLAVYPWGEEHPSSWKLFPHFSGRLAGDNEASPPGGGI
ncbi:MAG: peptidoglycan-binding protein [Limnochordales bacterium]|nr:peptidoglycan-binding protein [Limnochordales bacterium]